MACGGEGPFAADFHSSLDPAAVVDDLSAADKRVLCEEIATYAQLAVSERALDILSCRVGAVLANAPDVAACEADRVACGEVGLVDIEPPDTSFCDGAVANACATTVGALEDCYSASRRALRDALDEVACTMDPSTASAQLLPPKECAVPASVCSAYFPHAPQGDPPP